jgi:hypothetical protein
VNDKIDVDTGSGVARDELNAEPGPGSVDLLDANTQANVDAPRSGFRGEPIDDIRIELRQDAVMPLEHNHFSPGECRNMRELSRDVPSADERNTPRQVIKLQKIGACRQMFFAGNAKSSRDGFCSDQDELRFEHVIADFNRTRPPKTGAAANCIYAVLGKILFPLMRYRIGETALEGDEPSPVDQGLAPRDSLAAHPPILIERLRNADQNLLRIATAQGTCPTEWLVVDDGNPPPGSPAAMRSD